MVGHRDPQRDFFQVADMPHRVPENSFYARMGGVVHSLFSDDDFAAMYSPDKGVLSIPPSITCATLLLQFYDNVSDREAVDRLLFDIRWKVAIDLPLDYEAFHPTTLVKFRNRLLENGNERFIFDRFIETGKELGLIANRITLLSDTTPVKGAGAVMDTFTLIRKGIRKILRTIGFTPKENTNQNGRGQEIFEKYLKNDEKASINWDDRNERRLHLDDLVKDADYALELAKAKLENWSGEEEEKAEVAETVNLVSKILSDDTEKDEEGKAKITEGVAKDRIISITDPEMRHGRKSSSKVINGFKTSVSTDEESGFIMDVHDIPANHSDGADLLETIKDTEKNTAVKIERVLADGAYGTGENRRRCAEEFDEPIDLISPLSRPKDPEVDKRAFDIDLENEQATCPEGVTVEGKKCEDKNKDKRPYFKFEWPRGRCVECRLFKKCVKSKTKGRSLRTNVNEKYLEKAWERQQSSEWKKTYNTRANVERTISEVVKHGIRETRYFGKLKRNFQRLMTGAVVNLKRLFHLCDPLEIQKGGLVPMQSG